MSDLEQASLFAKHKKREILRDKGVDVEALQKQREDFYSFANISNGPLDTLDPNYFNENKHFEQNHDRVSERFKNASELDLLDYMVAETVHDKEALDTLREMDDAARDSKDELDAVSYDEILRKIGELKRDIPPVQKRSGDVFADEGDGAQRHSNWNSAELERRFVEKVLSDKD